MNKISLPKSEKESGLTKSEAISSSSTTESEKVNHCTAIKSILLFTIAFHICGGEPHTPACESSLRNEKWEGGLWLTRVGLSKYSPRGGTNPIRSVRLYNHPEFEVAHSVWGGDIE